MTDRDKAVLAMMPDAKKVARRAQYSYGVDADDVQQEACLQMLLSYARPARQKATDIRTYLYYAIRKSVGVVVEFGKPGDRQDDIAEVEIAADTKEVDPLFQKALAEVELTPDRVDILVRHYAMGETWAEIAADTGRSRQAVHKAHALALDRIRGVIKP